jgi:hypothetical protein
MIAAYIDQIIMFCAGAWITAVGFGYLPAPAKDPFAQQQWMARFGKLFKICGPLLLVAAMVLAVGKYLGVAGAG